jgi:DNA polymerase III gamma/tau subunit
METLSRVSNGDLRKAITTLQSASRLKGPVVEPQTLLDVSGAVPPEATQKLLAASRGGTFAALQRAVSDVIAEGYGVRAVLVASSRVPCNACDVIELEEPVVRESSKAATHEAVCAARICHSGCGR